MAKASEVQKNNDVEVDKAELNKIAEQLESRELYQTGFRNIDTTLGYNVYNEKTGELIQTNRGILSGSWITVVGISHSGKSTLGVQMLSIMMRKYIHGEHEDPRVKLHIIDVENGVHRERFKQLTGWNSSQLAKHVIWESDCSIEGFQDIITNIIKEKSDKSYTKIKTISSQGEEIEIYPPSFIFVDAISELISREVLDIDTEATNTMYLRQNLLLDQLVKKNKHAFVNYNINILAIAHQSQRINMANPMAKPLKEWKGLPADIKINGGAAIRYASDIGIYMARIEASDSAKAEKLGGKVLGASSIMETRIFKSRQSGENGQLWMVYNMSNVFDPLATFIYDAKKNKVLEAIAGSLKINGTDYKVRSQDFNKMFLEDMDFRIALFEAYDEAKKESLETFKRNKEDSQRLNSILDAMLL